MFILVVVVLAVILVVAHEDVGHAFASVSTAVELTLGASLVCQLQLPLFNIYMIISYLYN